MSVQPPVNPVPPSYNPNVPPVYYGNAYTPYDPRWPHVVPHMGFYPPPQPTNSAAIVALVMAFVVPVVGLVIGLVAMSQIRKTHERGNGMAVAAVVIGLISTIIFVGLFVSILTAVSTTSGYYG